MGEDPSSAKQIQGLYICPDNEIPYRVVFATQNNYPARAGVEPIVDDAVFTGTGLTFVPLGRQLAIDVGSPTNLDVTFQPTTPSLDGGLTTQPNYVQKARVNGRFFSYGLEALSSVAGRFSIPLLAIDVKEEIKR